MKKIIFLDIDGTIRDFDGYIPDSTVQAIKKAKESGCEVCICSGRPYFMIEKQIIDIGFDGIIAGSGSYIKYKGTILQHRGFTEMTYLVLSAYLIEHKCTLEFQCYDDSYILESQAEAFLSIGEGIQESLGIDAKQIRKEIPKQVKTLMDVSDVEKIMYFSNDLSTQEIEKKWGNDITIAQLSFPSTDKWAGEISPRDVDKSEGIRCILEASEWKREDVVAIGDSDNDMEMVAYASMGIAMGNAIEPLKEIANLVTAPLREDGIYKAFVSIGIIEE